MLHKIKTIILWTIDLEQRSLTILDFPWENEQVASLGEGRTWRIFSEGI